MPECELALPNKCADSTVSFSFAKLRDARPEGGVYCEYGGADREAA